jgi:murein DD-endopeptidase MepM/ murein hydrolase activator NlpD
MGLKKLAVKLRKTVKIAVILTVATIIILGLIQIFYKQTYSVSLNGEVIGYTNNKIELQEKINNYLKNGNGDGASFVEIKNLPTYKVCLLKKGISTNDGEIYEKVISSGISYYKYYAITVKDEEKSYVATFSDAEEAVKQLKDKNSNNSSELGIVEKYGVKNLPEGVKIASDDDIDEDEDDEDSEEDENDGTEKTIKISEVPEISSVDDTVNKVYEKPVINVSKTKENTSAYKQVAKTVVSETSYPTNLGVTLIQPVSGGTISSRFGIRSRDNHKGLDIAAPRGTAIKAAASGTVIFAGSGAPYSGYGNVVVIQSTSSVTIRYGHCSALYVKKGESVVQGQVIAAVGSTGISTGNHLHFEIRYNGKAVNPQNYVYK